MTLIKPPNEFFQFHSGSLAYNLLNAFEAAAQADLRVRAHLRCAQAAIAAERYRMAHGTWPSGLDSLVFHGLPRIPIDPFDGKAIRMARTGDGLVLYSVGFDLEDDGGRLDPKPTSVSEGDLGFRLWEPARRRQAPVVENTLPSNVFAAEPP